MNDNDKTLLVFSNDDFPELFEAALVKEELAQLGKEELMIPAIDPLTPHEAWTLALDAANAERLRVCNAAYAEYDRIQTAADAEHSRIWTAAYAEHERACEAADAVYELAIARELTEQEKKDQ